MAEMLKRVPNILLSISATTREPRSGEEDGVDYIFRSEEAFKEDILEERFLEWANIYGDFYGTPKEPIEKGLAENKLVILEIDIQGAIQIQNNLGDNGVYIFIAPPSINELRRRLVERKTETKESLETRLKIAEDELTKTEMYDYVIINDDLMTAANTLCEIVSEI